MRVATLGFVFSLFGLVACAAVDGTVTNGTTGKAQPNVILQLIQPGQGGMQTLGTTKTDASGHFQFADQTPGPRLVQAIFGGATYTKMIPPGAPSTGVAITVQDSTSNPSTVKPGQHIYIVQPSADGIDVEEVLFVKNDTNKTYNDSGGTLRFYLPESMAASPVVNLTSPDSPVGVEREAEKTGKPGVYAVSFPMKPGETKIEITYKVQAGADRIFKTRILEDGGNNRLVVPLGVTAQGDNLSPMGQDPQNKAAIYDIKGKELAVVLKGEAAPPTDAGAGGAGGGDAADESGAPQVEQSNPRIYSQLPLVLTLSIAILAVGFVLMYRARPRAVPASAASERPASRDERSEEPGGVAAGVAALGARRRKGK